MMLYMLISMMGVPIPAYLHYRNDVYMRISMMEVPIPVYLHYRNDVLHAYSHDGSPNSRATYIIYNRKLSGLHAHFW